MRRFEPLSYKEPRTQPYLRPQGKQMKRSLAIVVQVLLIAGMTFVVTSIASQAQAQSQKRKAAKAQAQAAGTQPHLDEAYRKLRRAHYLLNNACRTLGGNRMKANQQIEQALNEVQAGITAEHGSVPTISESSNINVTPGQIHPYIHDALQKCRDAKTQLQAAQAAGGHRDNAIQYIDAAVPFLQAAIQEPPCH